VLDVSSAAAVVTMSMADMSGAPETRALLATFGVASRLVIAVLFRVLVAMWVLLD
jgi:hypothetical protein